MNSELIVSNASKHGFSDLSFSSKSDYLLFVAIWKLAYKDLSRHIRLSKQVRKEWQRSLVQKSKLSPDDLSKSVAELKTYALPTEIHGIKLPTYSSWLPRASLTATAMLSLRSYAKVVANDQYNAAKAAQSTQPSTL